MTTKLRHSFRGMVLLLMLPWLASCSTAPGDWFAGLFGSPPSVIPLPSRTQMGSGSLMVSEGDPIAYDPADEAAKGVAAYFVDLVRRTRGLTLRAQQQDGVAVLGIVLQRLPDPTATGKEGYRLDVTPNGIVISASQTAGLLYGCVTLWQLMTQTPGSGAVTLSALHIEDAPRFAWRGLLLDSVRHYQSPVFIKSFIDTMALHKLNVLHWHLTDDQGWRLEIKKYPRLTEIGAWRVPAGAAPAADIDPATQAPRLYGGYYTQAQAREIVTYAAARNITVVPEIEMPGHSTAAIVAYPKLGLLDHPPTRVPSDWGIYQNLYNADDSTFAFLEDVLSEVMEVFPSLYIHIGGDEAVKTQWQSSAAMQARMRELGLTSEEALEGYFVQRIGGFLNARGRRAIGWDEILEGGAPPDTMVMSWRGIAGAVTAAKTGHDTVLTPAPTLYMDNRQSGDAEEPPGRGQIVTLADVYNFDPAPPALSSDERAHILGVQANLWTEHIRTEERVDYMAFPRAAALAEIGWSTPEAHNWKGFLTRLAPEFDRYRALGIAYAPSALRPKIAAHPEEEFTQASVDLSDQASFGDFRYSTDGTSPNAYSDRYNHSLKLALPVQLNAATSAGDRVLAHVSRPLDSITLRHRFSQELELCSSRIALNLEDDAPLTGPRAVFLVDIMNPCWIYRGADLTGVTAVEAGVGQVPFNFQIGDQVNVIKFHAPQTPDGELEVHLDSCTGSLLADMPLAPARDNNAITTLHAPIALQTGAHDLCFMFAQNGVDPLWALDWVQPLPQATVAGR
ncbi:MAG TPA: family 20 glycosylhydrolase [Rhizomicrobium sp.]